ncbi:helix-turn-helix transcriptional regulator [Lentilitoribacter sp. Alg239-R112]|uniref:helix-turn-helix domain-containing protein n=1 Tax=Lentilitoribacter sp. Alg239-R112 TaxID=2305987 RepID=UPI0013A6A4E2|nr:helix-turn-helix transcriptional regulator [Lentilitoribacter sp. Alg239-R112]
MDIFAKRLKERAKQLGVSNSEAARRAGLEERRYGHYVTGRNEPDLATLKRIAEALGTTPNWLLGVVDLNEFDTEKVQLVERFINSANILEPSELNQLILQVEAVAAAKGNVKKES